MIRIEIDNKKYGSIEVLKNISLLLEFGKVYGIAGENGAGKTTLFKCIAGLENYEGKIQSDLNPLKNYLGYLPAEPFFFNKITGHEYLQLHCNARNIQYQYQLEKNIFELPLHRYVAEYSTGMKKKLAITGILLQKNQIFILDEPFNGIDIQSNMLLTEIIRTLKTRNHIVLISSHIFSTLSATCDEIYYLKPGNPIKQFSKNEFSHLESEMKSFSIGNKIEKLFNQ